MKTFISAVLVVLIGLIAHRSEAAAPNVSRIGEPVEVVLDKTHSLVVRNVELKPNETIYVDLNNDGIPELKMRGYATSGSYLQVSFTIDGKSIGIIHARVYRSL